MSRGGAVHKPRTRTIPGIPGTVEYGFKEKAIIEQRIPRNVREAFERQGVDSDEMKLYLMGACSIFVGHEPAGVGGEKLWHLTISTPSRHPTWDEIKIARYRLLPKDLCFAIMLPPSEYYVNVEEQDHVFQLWEVNDPRKQWTTG
jgi:hypothetical protein